MLLQVHDELVFEAPDDEVEATIALVAKVMVEAPEPALQLSVPLQVDARAARQLGRGALGDRPSPALRGRRWRRRASKDARLSTGYGAG